MKFNKFFIIGFYGLAAALALVACSTAVLADYVDTSLDKRTPICPQKRNTPQAPYKFINMSNPLEPTEENIEAGKKLFLGSLAPIPCTTCHGVLGNGLGDPDFESKPPSRNFTCNQTMNHIPDGQLFWIIKTGVPRTAMPSFKSLADEQVWQLILQIRQFGYKASVITSAPPPPAPQNE